MLAGAVFTGLSLASYDPADPPAQSVYPVRTEVSNLCGIYGAQWAHHLRTSLGLGAYFALITVISTDLRLFARRNEVGVYAWTFGFGLALTAFCVALHMFVPQIDSANVVGNGGYWGAWGSIGLQENLSSSGALMLIASAFIAGTLFTGETYLIGPILSLVLLPLRVLGWLLFPSRRRRQQVGDELDDEMADEELEDEESLEDEYEDEEEYDDEEAEHEVEYEDEEEEYEDEEVEPEPRPMIKVNPPITLHSGSDDEEEAEYEDEEYEDEEEFEYELPDVELLEEAEEFPFELLAEKAQIAAETLERTFQEFGLDVRVVEVDTGPVITQFELELEAGLRLSKVTALTDDLAIALRVPSVRVVPSIPGKNTVGIEVPNEKQVMVRLKELIETSSRDLDQKKIPLFLGKDVSGRPLMVDMAKMPHLLIAGRTGTGKSVCLNSLILSILMTRTPDEVKMLMIDPKMVELSPYKRVPHLMHPVITDMKKAEAVLAWAVDKMEERYTLLSKCGVRHLDEYNELDMDTVYERTQVDSDSEEADSIPEHMPYIVIIADEMADMMMTSGKDVEGHIIRLAQKSRAVGIHLILATQKPTVDVITGLIKSNLPARVSFQVASKSDSRVVLDESGADRLLGNGDMLFLAPGTSSVVRAQGAFVSGQEIDRVIDFFGDMEPEYSEELARVTTASAAQAGDIESLRKRDELYEQAIDVVIREGRGSVSLLQRALGIGYGRAARLVDYMAEDGIVGDYNGSQAREVLYTPEKWAAFQAGEELEPAGV